MDRIRHRVGVRTSLDRAYRATHDPAMLVGWWPQSAQGDPAVGSKLALEFPGFRTHVWELVELVPHRLVVMKLIDGPDPWHGSVLRFELEEGEGQIWITLVHETPPGIDPDAHLYFGTKWPIFLVSLKAYLETGRGMPYPEDLPIQD